MELYVTIPVTSGLLLAEPIPQEVRCHSVLVDCIISAVIYSEWSLLFIYLLFKHWVS